MSELLNIAASLLCSVAFFQVKKAEEEHLVGLDMPRSEMCHKTNRVVSSEVFRWYRFVSLVATVSN